MPEKMRSRRAVNIVGWLSVQKRQGVEGLNCFCTLAKRTSQTNAHNLFYIDVLFSGGTHVVRSTSALPQGVNLVITTSCEVWLGFGPFQFSGAFHKQFRQKPRFAMWVWEQEEFPIQYFNFLSVFVWACFLGLFEHCGTHCLPLTCKYMIVHY